MRIRYLGYLIGALIGCVAWAAIYAQEDSPPLFGPCSVDTKKKPEETVPFIPDFGAPRGYGILEGTARCEGWNACPCEEDCENERIAACEALNV